MEYQQELAKARQVLPSQLYEFLEVFAQKEYRLPDHGKHGLPIRLKKGATLVCRRCFAFGREESLEIRKELLAKGKVRTSRSESAVGTLFVPKSDGSKRWCMDMRPVNNATIADENKSPLQDRTALT